jgi:mannose-6-phosphate isomerase-like protein (cupin superfamily)
VDIRSLDRDALTQENGLDAQRLMPWPTLNAPYAHAHHEYEIFIAVSGSAVLESQGRQEPFRAGDIVHFAPHVEHRVVNDGDADFEMYSVWWDAEMAQRFASRHEGAHR